MSKKPEGLLAASPISTNDLGVDRDQRIIRGVKIMELGSLNEGDIRPWAIDQVTLDQVLESMARPNKGIKARFTHDAAWGTDGLRTHLGRWGNPRFDESSGAVRADIQFAEAASKSPAGDLADYLMTLAEEDPESFGVSVHFQPADDFGDELDEQGRVLVRLSGLYSADFVSDPAATRGGLFSLLEEGPMAQGKNEESKAPEGGALNQEPSKVEVTLDSLKAEAQPFVEAFGADGAQAYLNGKSLLDCYQAQAVAHKEQIKELQGLVEELQVQLQAAEAASGESDPLSSEPGKEKTPAQLEKEKKKDKAKKSGASDFQASWLGLYSPQG